MFDEEEMTDEFSAEENKTSKETRSPVIHWELNMDPNATSETTGKITGDKLSIAKKKENIHSPRKSETPSPKKSEETKNTPVPAASGGYLARPSNIYAETQAEVFTSTPSAEEPVPATVNKQTEEDLNMQLVVRDDIPAADLPLAHQAQPPLTTDAEEPPVVDEAEEQKRRAAERLHKLRNLSFNVNGADPNNEFENVPAYIRRNMELYGNSFSAIENFYSNYEVKKDDNNQTQISTINTFLDGKKPD
jgi:cell division protein FtsZ